MRKKSKVSSQKTRTVSPYDQLSTSYMLEELRERTIQPKLSIYEFLTTIRSYEALDDARLPSQLKDNEYTVVENNRRFPGEKYFLICNSCFWSASYFKNQNSFPKCPLCEYGEIECMPIGHDENYSFHYSPTKGVELEFSHKIGRAHV